MRPRNERVRDPGDLKVNQSISQSQLMFWRPVTIRMCLAKTLFDDILSTKRQDHVNNMYAKSKMSHSSDYPDPPRQIARDFQKSPTRLVAVRF